MNIFFEKHFDLIKKLLEGNVLFILIGGYAVNFHGYNRTTGDLDLWVKPDNENKTKLIAVLTKMGFNLEDLEAINKMDFTKILAFNFWEVPFKVDVLTQIAGVKYEIADNKKVLSDIDGIMVPFLHLDHLVISKISNNRTKDKLDVEELQKIAEFKNKKN